jgi:hypothetical protein
MSDLGSFIAKSAGMVKDASEAKEQEALPLTGIEDARVLLQVFNIYNDRQAKSQPDVIDAEFNES